MLLTLTCWVAFAQSKITGTVTSADDGSGIPGVSVQIKGTSKGTQTDADGKYAIEASSNQTLVFSFVGMVSKEVAVGNKTVLNVALESDSRTLSEVIVTAQGIQRERKALGYAATTVATKDIANKPETDLGRALMGRTPGIQIASSSGLTGSGTKINIRGISSISGNTQPLWIVDGVPINTAANENNSFIEGNITPTRSLDIDPNNIENISILRGLSATTLYGSAGRNGVILVTTKGAASGKSDGKFSGSVSHSLNTINAIVPEYQNVWANGFDGVYGEFFSNWGSLFEIYKEGDQTGFNHPYYEHRALFPENPEFASRNYVPQAYPNNVSDFFRQGLSNNTSINLGMRGAKMSFNTNYSHLDESGYIMNNNLLRDNFNIGGNAKLTKKLSVTGTFNYVKTNFKSPPSGAGYGSNAGGGPSVFANIFYTPRNLDLMGWPYQNPVTGASVWYRNNGGMPNARWLLENTGQTSNTDRFFGTLSAKYDLTDWMNLSYRIGLDTYSEVQDYWSNKGAPYEGSGVAMVNGLLRTTSGVNNITDHSVILGINKKLTEDLDITSNIGVNGRFDTYSQSGIESSNQVVFGLLSHRNFINKNDRTFRGTNLNYFRERALLGAFLDATFGYKDFLYLNVQGRNDWASTHEAEYRSLFYPGASVSFVPTSAFPNFKSEVLDLLKFRAGYGTSANFADPYQTRPYLTINTNKTVDAVGNVIALSLPSLLANPNLKPELLTELEGGVEAQFFHNRIGFDLSVYRRIAKDQIISRPLDPSTGFTETSINAGTIRNQGFELGLNLTPLKFGNFDWTIRNNFTLNRSKVLELPEGSKEILVSGFSDLGNFAIEGMPFNVIQGTYVKRNENGDLLVNGNGDWVISDDIKVIGDPNPDFMLSVINDFSYKSLSLSVMIDYVHGGDMLSYTASSLIGRGVAKDLEIVNPELSVILPGVSEETGLPNDIPMPASGWGFGNNIIGGAASDRAIYDATRIRLRMISLNYNLPSSIFGNSFIKGASVAVNGNNIWFRAINTPKSAKVDADRTAFGTGNGAGFDFLGGPSASRYGATLKLDF